ncbi:hypothetical protein X777_12989 [Ooceraea biroi]|uniref:Uncharacterized protein n=1 Tax=Ooceraea biroi TaxID=2015173 RepID=A0A026W039_OOCBI|nr:hypothetical protein X777_12989 [Ooceraea biroi]
MITTIPDAGAIRAIQQQIKRRYGSETLPVAMRLVQCVNCFPRIDQFACET